MHWKAEGFCCNYHPVTHENRTEWYDARSVLNFVLRPVFVCSDHFQKMCLGIDKGFEWQARHILIISVVLKFLIICESIDAPWWSVAFENSSPWSRLADYKSKLYNNASGHPIMYGISTARRSFCKNFNESFVRFLCLFARAVGVILKRLQSQCKW